MYRRRLAASAARNETELLLGDQDLLNMCVDMCADTCYMPWART